MSIRTAIALLPLLAACKHGSKKPADPPPVLDAAAPAPDAAAPPAGPLTIDPEKTYHLPPPEAGYTRAEGYDVELKTGTCLVAVDVPRTRTPFGALIVPEVELERTVGTLALTCSGNAADRACIAAACATLRAVPGGSAEEDYPTEAPALSLSSAGGFAGIDRGGADVFADGTVQYHGPKCTRWRGRHGHLTAAARDALFAKVTASGFEAMTESSRDEAKRLGECSDDVYTTIVWKGTARTLGCHAVPELTAAIAAIEAAVFPNPCG